MTTTENRTGWHATTRIGTPTIAHYFADGKCLCGAARYPGLRWRPQLGNDRPATCPTCDECRDLHARRWAGEGK
jgi:hypothetical protein